MISFVELLKVLKVTLESFILVCDVNKLKFNVWMIIIKDFLWGKLFKLKVKTINHAFLQNFSVSTDSTRFAILKIRLRSVWSALGKRQYEERGLLYGHHRHTHSLRAQETIGQRGQNSQIWRRPRNIHRQTRTVFQTISWVCQQNNQLDHPERLCSSRTNLIWLKLFLLFFFFFTNDNSIIQYTLACCLY